VVYEAVVFDFYGTLSVSASRTARFAGAARVAAVLGIPAEEFQAATVATFEQRATGSCGDVEQTMRWLAEYCGGSPSAAQVTEACAVRLVNEEIDIRALRDDAESTVRAVRDAGYKIGLISDCVHELPAIWPSLPIAPHFDAMVFSVEAGTRKPHPDMYTTITRALGVEPSACLYVGDGGSNELTGAQLAGMSAVQLITDDHAQAITFDREADWDGPTIHALSEVIGLLEASSPG
jgi:putative hydrolase of the HAD superfamily